MAMVLINWLYIAITSFLTGYGILGLFARLTDYKVRHTSSYFLAGLTVVTVYAQIFSLFSGVALGANLLLLAVCAGIAIRNRKSLNDLAAEEVRKLNKEKWKYAAYMILTFLMAYGTSRGYMHFDTGLYHAQSIRWIEEYGVVPGLANIQARFGYNSAAFPLTALYSMKALFGQSLHTTAGFFALLGSVYALDLYKVFREKRVSLADFARIGLVFYLGVIFSQIVSPASDYYAQLLLFIILILWLDEDEYQTRMEIQDPIPYGLICVLIVYAVTIKFSVAVLLLFVLKPAVMLLKKKEGKQIGAFLAGGLLTSMPFFIRNVMISGWLVYPFAGIDLFSVDWKIPKGQVQYDAMEIGLYGKGITDVTKWDTPFSVWAPSWFVNLKALEKVFVIMTLAAIVAGVIYLIYCVAAGIKRKIIKKDGKTKYLWNGKWNFLLVFVVFVVSTMFWFVSAPLVRYGYAYVTVVPLITFGYFYVSLLEQKKGKFPRKTIHRCFCLLLVLFLLTRVKGLANDILRTWKEPYYYAQMDYIDGEALTRIVGGVTFYEPEESGQIGYEKFPSSLFAEPFELRGESIEDGFRQTTE